MAKQIKSTDLIEDKIFANLIEQAEQAKNKLAAMNVEFTLMGETIKRNLETNLLKTTKGLNDFIEASAKASNLSKQQAQVLTELQKKETELEKTRQQAIISDTKRTQQAEAQLRLSKLQRQEDEKAEAAAKRLKKQIDNESNAYTQLSNKVRDLKNRSKELAAQLLEQGKNTTLSTKELKELQHQYEKTTKAAQAGDKALKHIDKSVGDSFRNVGNYTSAFMRLQAVLGNLGIFISLSTIIRSVTSSMIDFDQKLGDLSALTGLRGDDLDYFKGKAIELGKSVEGGASAVAEAYKLIGSKRPELLKDADALNYVTESAIKLSRASGMDLPLAAESLSHALNQFNAPARQAGEFINVLANAALFGAAEIPQVTESLLRFGSVAKTSNISLSESTALIEMLSLKGLAGSEAGTALRNILLKFTAPEALPKRARVFLKELQIDTSVLADKTLPLTERLKAMLPILKSDAAQVRVFGLENVVAAKNILLNIDQIEALNQKMNTNGTITKQEEARTKTLSFALIELKGNWQKFWLETSDNSLSLFGNTLAFAAKNVGGLLSILLKLGVAYIAIIGYQKASIIWTRLMAANWSQFTTNIGLARSGVLTMTTALTASQKAALMLNAAFKTIGFAVLIDLAIRGIQKMYDVFSGAEQLRNDGEKREIESQKSMSRVTSVIEKIFKNHNEKMAEIRRLYTKGVIKTDEELNAHLLKQQQLNVNKVGLETKRTEGELEDLKTIKEEFVKNIEVREKYHRKSSWETNTNESMRLMNERSALVAKTAKLLNVRTNDMNKFPGLYEEDFADVLGSLNAKIKGKRKEIFELKKASKEAINEFEDLNAVVVGQKNKDKSIDGILDKPEKEAKTFNTTFRETLDLLSEYEKLQNKLQNTEIELNLITTQTNIDDSLRLAISKATDSGLTKNTFASKNVKDETGKSTTTTKNTTDNQDIEQVEKIILSKKEEKDKLAKINNDYSIKEIDRIVSDYKREEELKDENEYLTLKKQKKLNQKTAEGKKALAEIEKNYLVIQKQTADNVKVKEGDAIIEKQNIDVEFKKTQLQNTNEYYKDLEDANNAYNDALEKNAESSNEKAIAKQLKKQEREKNLLKGLISLTKLSADYFIRQSERKIEQIDKENNALEKQQGFLQDLAANGNIRAEQSLIQNQKLIEQKNVQKAKEQKRIERIKLGESVINTYLKNIESGEKNPIVKTISDISVLTAFIATLPTFYEGTETDVASALGTPQLKGKDGFIVRVDGGEKILNPELSKMTGNMTTMEIAKLAEDKLRGRLMNKTTINQKVENNEIMIKKLDELNNTMKNKIEYKVEVGEILGGVMHIIETQKRNNTTNRSVRRLS